MKAQPHPYSHLPIPTEKEMEEIIQIIVENRYDPQMLEKIELITPPHIMKALQKYSMRKVGEAKRKAEAQAWMNGIEAWAKDVENWKSRI